MKYIAKTSVKGLFLLITGIVSFSALSVSASDSGQIRFVGRIIEAPCDISYNNNVITQTCMRNNKPIITRTSVDKGGVQSPGLVNNNVMTFNWINKEKNLGVTTITYN